MEKNIRRQATDGEQNKQYIAIGHLLANLKQRTISSSIVTLGAQGVLFALNLASIMILARMLTPQDFGLVAMVATVMGFLRIFKNVGLSTATIQRDDITHAQVSNLFWTNLCVSTLITLLVAICGPVIASFYREPRLVAITQVLSLTFLLEGLAAQHLAILSRQMHFQLLALIQISAMIAAVVLAVVMAWRACGYWSLVALQFIPPAVVLILTWLNSRWRPQLPTRNVGTRSLLNFGANLAAGEFIWSLARGTDGLLIGKFFGPDSIGIYSRAAALLYRPLDQLLSPINAVYIPVLSRVLSEPERYRRTFLQVYEAVALASFFLSGIFFALARPVTLVVLGPKWEEAVPVFAGFTIGAVFLPLCSVATWLFTSQGRGRDLLIANSIVSGLAVCSIIAGMPFGLAGVAFAFSVSGLMVLLPIMLYIAGRVGPVTISDLSFASLRYVLLWAAVCGATSFTRSLVSDFSPMTQLAFCVPVGFLVGAAFIYCYAPSREFVLNLCSDLKTN